MKRRAFLRMLGMARKVAEPQQCSVVLTSSNGLLSLVIRSNKFERVVVNRIR